MSAASAFLLDQTASRCNWIEETGRVCPIVFAFWLFQAFLLYRGWKDPSAGRVAPMRRWRVDCACNAYQVSEDKNISFQTGLPFHGGIKQTYA